MSSQVAAPIAVRRVVVFANTELGQTEAALAAASAAADRASCTLLPDPRELNDRGARSPSLGVCAEPPRDVDLCLALGGDGTILQALRTFAGTEVPVFGINFGTVGFLAAAERDALEQGLERAFSGDFLVMELPGLSADVETERPIALNDVSLIRKPHGRVAELAYRLGGEEVGNVRCDGLVAATPAGSTGYNLANQGPILAWGVKGYVVSFIAAHTLTARALVVAPDDVLHVVNGAGRDPLDIVLDGDPVGELASGDELSIRFRESVGHLAQLPGSNFYRRIREKFGHLAH